MHHTPDKIISLRVLYVESNKVFIALHTPREQNKIKKWNLPAETTYLRVRCHKFWPRLRVY